MVGPVRYGGMGQCWLSAWSEGIVKLGLGLDLSFGLGGRGPAKRRREK